MNEERSIKQMTDALPNFRNLGVTLRLLLIANAFALLAAILQADDWPDIAPRMMQIATLFMPILLGSMITVWFSMSWLGKLSYWQGVLVVNILVGLFTLSSYFFGGELIRPSVFADHSFYVARGVLLSAVMCSLILMYFRLRAKVLSRSLDDARLQVLRARIRPHFLYNTINAVLGIVRTQPRQAETALEDMADLFRMAMADERDMVPVYQEIQLCKQYLALEQLRMGERLRVLWQVQDVPQDALIPPLLLQPLLENAVYHGIEPLINGGCIHVQLRLTGSNLTIKVNNPCPQRSDVPPHAGNKIALQNIRERLDLLFDAEASYQVASGEDHYLVEITLPYMKEPMT
ncbi:MAG: sensor histidine kinase [Gallionella sp.]|nr:sensor histidine kinase [Gallionella sp.]